MTQERTREQGAGQGTAQDAVELEVRVVAYDDPLAAPLIADLIREYDERYPPRDGQTAEVELYRYPAERFAESGGGLFLLLLEDGEPVAGGAFMSSEEPGSVEVKRVWTHPAHRRRGLARRVMSELEAAAAARGVARIVLTTGGGQPEAIALYHSVGYSLRTDVGIDDWEQAGYRAFEKALRAE